MAYRPEPLALRQLEAQQVSGSDRTVLNDGGLLGMAGGGAGLGRYYCRCLWGCAPLWGSFTLKVILARTGSGA